MCFGRRSGGGAHLCRTDSALDVTARAFQNRGRRDECRCLTRQRPSPVLLDANRHGLVTVRVEVLEDRRGRGERHLVFAGSPPVDDADAEFFHRTVSVLGGKPHGKLTTCLSVFASLTPTP